MSKGQKTAPETIYLIMASYAVTGNYMETSRETGIAVSTVKKIVDENIDKPEFEKLCNEKKAEFANRATEIINKAMRLLNKRLDRALSQEESLDLLIDEIFATEREELSQDEKKSLVSKIRALQLQDIKAITTAIGTLYDKRALANGSATDKVVVEVNLPEGMSEYAE